MITEIRITTFLITFIRLALCNKNYLLSLQQIFKISADRK